MEVRRAQLLLLIAFAISLLLHAAIALRMNWPFARPHDEPQIVSLEHRARIATITKTTPTPRTQTPPPLATPAATAAPVHAPRATKPLGIHGKPAGAPATVAKPASTPVPTATPAGTACTKSDANAAIVTAPAPPDLAPAVRAGATNAIVRVLVKLDDNGAVTDALVTQSSGNGSLDLVAVSMARSARYAPAYHACKPTAGTYNFSARFIPW